MKLLEALVGQVLRDFCHVEWFEVDELAAAVAGGRVGFDVAVLRAEFEHFCANPVGIAAPINQLTANEFESDAEAKEWLAGIHERVFGPQH